MQSDIITTPNVEMIVVPLDEYKELLAIKGRAEVLEHEIIRTRETLDNFIKLQCTMLQCEVRV